MSENRSLDVGDIHDVLRNDRRREVLSELKANSGEATIRELSERIASAETGEDPPPRNVRQSVYVSLHQTHLPKLDELGIVDYDTDGKTVKLRSEAEAVREYMTPPDAGEPSLPLAYVLLGLAGLVTSVAIAFNFADGMGVVEWAPSVLFAAIVVIAVYHLYSGRNDR